MNRAQAQDIHYRVELDDIHAHLFRITLDIASPLAEQRLQLPVWIPGSYLVREFAKNLQKLSAKQAGRAVPVTQQDKASWLVTCKPGLPL